MPQEKRTRHVFKKGTKIGLPNGMWMKGKRGEIITLMTDEERILADATNLSMPKEKRDQAWKALVAMGGL